MLAQKIDLKVTTAQTQHTHGGMAGEGVKKQMASVRLWKSAPGCDSASVLPALTYINTSEGVVANARVLISSDDIEVFNPIYLQMNKYQYGTQHCTDIIAHL